MEQHLPAVLCVDDETLVLEGLRRQLRREFAIETAVGAADAITTFRRRGPFPVAVVDYNMPQTNGIELLAALREIAPDTVAIMLTGRAELDLAVRALHEGRIFRFLNKPCTRETLVHSIRDALEHHRLVTAERTLTEQLRTANAALNKVNGDLEQEVLARTQSLRALLQFMSALNACDSCEAVAGLVARHTADLLASERVSLLLQSGPDESLHLAAGIGLDRIDRVRLRESVTSGIARHVFAHGAGIVLNRPDAQSDLTDWGDIALFGGLPLGCAALNSSRGPVGVLCISRPRGTDHYADDVAAELTALADTAGIAVLNQLRRDERNETRDAVILALARLAEHRDPDTGAHLERVQRYCRLLAEHLAASPQFAASVDADFIENLVRSSPLHDIGKVGVPDGILLKPGRLTPDEFEQMKRHAVIGGDTIRSLLQQGRSRSFLQMGMEIAYAHHEKWDGSGYPRGLRGEHIPLPARIVAVADVYDALTSVRVYKAAMSHAEACAIIRDGAGRHFDPALVAAFDACADEFDRVRLALGDPAPPAPAPADQALAGAR